MNLPAKKPNYYPEPIKLVFSDEGLLPAIGNQGNMPEGLVLCSTKQGCCLTLEQSQCLVLSPIEIIHQGSKEKTLEISLGKSARLTLIEQFQDKVEQRNTLRIHLSHQAKMIHGQIVTGQNKKTQNTNVAVSVAAGAYYDAFTLNVGEVDSQQDVTVSLEDELSSSRLLGIHLLNGKSIAGTKWHVRHMAPSTMSTQIIKNVLNDAAKDSFTGKIFVDRKAQKTDGAQQSHALLLSNRTEMRSRPELEIYADDVKCSHGSTMGDLDEEALFYLQSRGIPQEKARQILIRAFIDGVLDQIQSPELRASAYFAINKESRNENE